MSIYRQLGIQAAIESVEYSTDSFNVDDGREDLLQQLGSFHSARHALDIHTRSAAALEALHTQVQAFSGTTMDRRTAQLMHQTYQAAISGLEQYHHDLPSLECFSGPMADRALAVSAESVGSALTRAIEIVVKAVKRLIQIMDSFFERLSPHLQALAFKLYRAHQLTKQITGRFPEVEHMALGTRGALLSTELAAPIDGAQLLRTLTEFTEQYRIINDNYVDYTERLAKSYQHAVRNLRSEEDAQRALGQLASELDKQGPQSFAPQFRSAKRVTDPRWIAGSAIAAAPLPGQRSLVIVDGRVAAGKYDESDPLQRIAALQGSKIELTRLNSSAMKDYSTVEIRTLSPHEIKEVLEVIDRLLGYVKHTVMSGRRMRIAEAATQIEQATTAIQAGEESKPMTTRLVMLGSNISGWLTSPYVSMTSLATSVIGAAIGLLHQHIDSYELDENKR